MFITPIPREKRVSGCPGIISFFKSGHFLVFKLLFNGLSLIRLKFKAFYRTFLQNRQSLTDKKLPLTIKPPVIDNISGGFQISIEKVPLLKNVGACLSFFLDFCFQTLPNRYLPPLSQGKRGYRDALVLLAFLSLVTFCYLSYYSTG